MSNQVYDHNPSAPVRYTLPAAVCGLVLYDAMPASHYPAGVYPAKEPDTAPDGMRDTRRREVIDGASCIAWEAEPPPPPEPVPTLAEAQAARIAALDAAHAEAVAQAFPTVVTLETLAGLRETGGADAMTAALVEFRQIRDAAAAAIAATTTLAGVFAVAWVWPEVEVQA